MQLCPNGHEIPEYANGYCARCGHEARNRGRYFGQRRFDPKRYMDNRGRLGDPYPSEGTELPPDKRMPNFRRLSQPKSSAKGSLVRKPLTKANPNPNVQPDSKTTPTFSPQRVLEGIEQLIDLVSEKEMSLELLLARAAVKPQMMAVFSNGRHPFVRGVRERWFALFKAILLNEEARVIVRKVGLDGLTRPTSMNDLAERCQLSVDEMRRHGGSGLRKLREFTNHNAVMACVVNSARQFLR